MVDGGTNDVSLIILHCNQDQMKPSVIDIHFFPQLPFPRSSIPSQSRASHLMSGLLWHLEGEPDITKVRVQHQHEFADWYALEWPQLA